MKPVALGLALAGCLAAAPPCTLPRLAGSKVHPFVHEARFCAPAALPVRRGAAQVLFDDSGSMKGFRAYLPQIALWSEQALSHVRQWGTEWTKTRGCYFSAARPLARCAEPRLRPAGFQGASDTTLNEASASAADYDLTLIVTDGASASSAARGDCATGVDAACVARALARALAPRPGQPQGVQGGLWVIPLVGMFEGPLYTEQPVAPDQVDAAAIAATVAGATATTAAVTNPRLSKGLLVYDYTGPRAFLAFVVARNAVLGRAFVAALQARMAFSQIRALASLKQYQNGLAALRPIEVFPGGIPPVGWARATVLEPVCLTLDAKLRSATSLSVGCANRADEAVVRLEAPAQASSQDCVNIALLPALSAGFRPAGALKAVRDYAWSATRAASGPNVQLHLRLSCSRDWRLKPGECEPGGSWLVQRDYAASASALAAGTSNRPAIALVHSISAPEVAGRPHLVFQLQETLEKFYRNALTFPTVEQASEITRLDLCRQ